MPLSQQQEPFDMPHRQVINALSVWLGASSYLAGIFGLAVSWAQAHPYLSMVAAMLGPALGVGVRWLLNRYHASRSFYVIVQERDRQIAERDREIERLRSEVERLKRR